MTRLSAIDPTFKLLIGAARLNNYKLTSDILLINVYLTILKLLTYYYAFL